VELLRDHGSSFFLFHLSPLLSLEGGSDFFRVTSLEHFLVAYFFSVFSHSMIQFFLPFPPALGRLISSISLPFGPWGQFPEFPV